jgi:hypothetical protein
VEGAIVASIETAILPLMSLLPLLRARASIPTVVLALAPFAGGRQAAEAEGAGEDRTDDG